MAFQTTQRHWFDHLQFRLILFSMIPVILLGIMSNIDLTGDIQKALTKALEERGRLLASEIAASTASLLEHKDSAAIQQVIGQFGTNEDVLAIQAYDSTGGILVAEGDYISDEKSIAGETWIRPSGDVLKSIIRDHQPKEWWETTTFNIAQPIIIPSRLRGGKEKLIGMVILQMDSQSVAALRKEQLSQRGLFFIISMALMGVFMVSLFNFSVIRPINRVRHAAQKMASGNLDTFLPVGGISEIAALSESFNQMAKKIQASNDEMQTHMHDVTILYEISVLTRKTLNLDEMFSLLASQLARLVNGTGAYISLWDDKQRAPVPQAAYGSFEEEYRSMEYWPGESTIIAKVLEIGQPIVVSDTSTSSLTCPKSVTHNPIKSLLGLPLIVNNRSIGVALIGDTQAHRTFSEHEIQTAMAAAGHIASAISNAFLVANLASERNRLENIINSISDPILVMDLNFHVQSVNKAFPVVTGINIGPHEHPSLGDVLSITPDQQPDFTSDISETIQHGEIWQREMVCRRADGSCYDADLAISSIHKSHIHPAEYVATLRDISVLKELDRMKTRFVSNVSHELRTPLSVITLHTENLLEFYDRLNDEKRQELLRDINTETNTLRQLIEDLLCLSRLDSGRAEPNLTSFNLGDLLCEVVSSFKSMIEEKHIVLTTTIPEVAVMINADHDQLRQVFNNLMSNAVKFTPSGGQIHLNAIQQDSQMITVEISDTGIGIPASDLPRMFERFYRSELSVQQEIPGTGLGLAISREILQRHQGSIEVESEVGEGSLFRVNLPVSSI
ncbi:MAG TPA: ATP-binding protein [Anaerolineaceae bacterium]|nr:ATP-binding protein [Anaerolineaceae bacterium]